jgi:hypothetical protein
MNPSYYIAFRKAVQAFWEVNDLTVAMYVLGILSLIGLGTIMHWYIKWTFKYILEVDDEKTFD